MTINTALLKKEEQAIFCLRELYQAFGYSQYKMRKFEEYDLYARNKSFLISDSVITFTDTNGKLMALKPDVTLSIVKNSKPQSGRVQKVYYNENVYRISGRSHTFGEIMQVGLECLGDIDEYCIGEVLSLAQKSLAAICDDYILDVSHMGLFSLLLDRVGISREKRDDLIAAISRKSLHDAMAICRAEEIPEERAELLRRLSECSGSRSDVMPQLHALFSDREWQSAVSELEGILSLLPPDRVRVDFSVINDQSYYNGIVFAGFVRGIPESILSGGQYDNLMHRMGKNAGAIGFAVYLDQLELLESAQSDYDIDTLLLYDSETSSNAIHAAVKTLTEQGVSVMVQKSIPEKFKYKQLCKITESGVETLETNA